MGYTDDELYREAILETCEAVPPLPLAAAPLPENDLGVAQVCPCCEGLDALVSRGEEGIESANCPDCGCNFSPKVESITRKVIRRLAERRARRARILGLGEEISPDPPPGVDPDDYACLRDVLGKMTGEIPTGKPHTIPGLPKFKRSRVVA